MAFQIIEKKIIALSYILLDLLYLKTSLTPPPLPYSKAILVMGYQYKEPIHLSKQHKNWGLGICAVLQHETRLP